jgi:hypothetical protein
MSDGIKDKIIDEVCYSIGLDPDSYQSYELLLDAIMYKIDDIKQYKWMYEDLCE